MSEPSSQGKNTDSSPSGGEPCAGHDTAEMQANTTDPLADNTQLWGADNDLDMVLTGSSADGRWQQVTTGELEAPYRRRPTAHGPPGGDQHDTVDPVVAAGVSLVTADGGDSARSVSDHSPDPDAAAAAGSPSTTAPGDQRARDWGRRWVLRLESEPGQLDLDQPWAQFVVELCQEVSASQTSPTMQSAYVAVVGHVLRLMGGLGRQASVRLEAAAAELERPVRSVLVGSIAARWDHADAALVEAIERLEAWDSAEQPDTAGVRRSCIVAERLAGAEVAGPIGQQLADMLAPPETLAGLALAALRAHQHGQRHQAAHHWRQLARRLRDEPRQTVVQAAALFSRETPEFFDRLDRYFDQATPPRPLLQMVQRQAIVAGDHLHEAVALRHLLVGDVARGRRVGPEHAELRERCKRIAAARFFRLSTLLEGLSQTQKNDPAVAELAADEVVADAVALAPRQPLYLRRLCRWSRRASDTQTCRKALRTLVRAYAGRRLAALASAELARTIHVDDGDPELVERFLAEAISRDPECRPARLALAYELIADGHDQRVRRLDDQGGVGAVGVDFAGDERRLIAQRRWTALADHLEAKLDDAVESDQWSTLVYRLAHLHGWYLSAGPTDQLRLDYLEQVLVAEAEHVAALVDILDIRLARGDYAEAAEVLECLAEQAVEPADRASWLAELAGLIEYRLVAPRWACDCFEAARQAQAGQMDAWLGVLRTDADPRANGAAVEAIVAQLDAGVSVAEASELAVELVLRADRSAPARQALDRRFPDDPLWIVVRLCAGVEQGRNDQAALDRLGRMWRGSRAQAVVATFDRFLGSSEPTGRRQLKASIGQLTPAPAAEGRLVTALWRARRLESAQLLGMIAAMESRRTDDPATRATNLAAMAATLMWLDRPDQALRVCSYVLERFPTFVPVLKLAKHLARRQGRWAEFARWCEREAEATAVDQIAFENRLVASEVQQTYLGDFAAACQQFRAVLADDPTHREAFAKLKPLLLQRGAVDELLQWYEKRLANSPEDARRAQMLNEMGDIALHQGHDRRAAIDYFSRAVDLDDQPLRSLRILAELYDDQGRPEPAIDCYRRAIDLTDNHTLLERLWRKVGMLCESAGRPVEALDAYEQTLLNNPNRGTVMLDIARLEAAHGSLESALIHLERLESTVSNPQILRQGRAKKARYLAELGRPHAEVVGAYRSLLVHHPDDLDAADQAFEYVSNHGRPGEPAEFFGAVAKESFRQFQGARFEAHFDIARRLGQHDRAFCLAALADAFDQGSAGMRAYHDRHCRHRRWPTGVLPDQGMSTLGPAGLRATFWEVLVAAEPGLLAASDSHRYPGGAGPAVAPKRTIHPNSGHPNSGQPGPGQSGSRSAALDLAFGWPAVFGVDVAQIYEVDELDAASVVRGAAGGAVELLLDRRWRRNTDPTGWLVHLGKQLAAWRLGVGTWHQLDAPTRVHVFKRIVGHFDPGWARSVDPNAASGLDASALDAWLGSKQPDSLARRAAEIAERLNPAAIDAQFQLVGLAVERAACLVIDDPARAVAHSDYLGAQNGLVAQPWSILVGPHATALRRRVGVAVDSSDSGV